ncbi:MAG: aminoacyl-tRNA hydrolase [Candidatus Pelagibacter ubique]
MYVIIGLGNPEFEFLGTRHNIGFDFINFLSKKWKIKIDKIKWKSEFGEGKIFFEDKVENVLLIKPLTYMNLSGEAVKEIYNNLKIDLKKYVIVHDDLDLPIGGIQFIFNRGDGGHNGIKSIINDLNTNQFFRLRIGIGRPPDDIDTINYVLSPIPFVDRKIYKKAFIHAEDILMSFIFYDEEKAVSKSNKKGIY